MTLRPPNTVASTWSLSQYLAPTSSMRTRSQLKPGPLPHAHPSVSLAAPLIPVDIYQGSTAAIGVINSTNRGPPSHISRIWEHLMRAGIVPARWNKCAASILSSSLPRPRLHRTTNVPHSLAMPAAFQTALPLAGRAVARPRAAPRRPTATTRAVATAPQPSRLRERAVVALRGMSDAAWVAMLHDAGVRLTVGCAAAGSGASPGSELMLGGLVGVWTGAAVAARLRRAEARAVSASAALGPEWHGVAEEPLLAAADADVLGISADEVPHIVAWLCALDELEGLRAAHLLWALTRCPDAAVRVATAHALAEAPTRANIASAVLAALAADQVATVRDAARAAHRALVEDGVLPRAGPASCASEAVVRSQIAAAFTGPAGEPATDEVYGVGLVPSFERAVDELGARALAVADNGGEALPSDVKRKRRPRLRVPLFDGLLWSEMHALCTIAALPLLYELYALSQGADLPLRFVGLGWVLAVGGLAAYPRSGSLWHKLQFACDRDAQQYKFDLETKGFVEWK